MHGPLRFVRCCRSDSSKVRLPSKSMHAQHPQSACPLYSDSVCMHDHAAAGKNTLQYVWDGEKVQALDEDTLKEGGDSPGVARICTGAEEQHGLFR